MDEADEEFVAVAPGCADAGGVEGDCGEAGRKPAQKSTKRKTRASLKVSFVTASPDRNKKVFCEWSIAEVGRVQAPIKLLDRAAAPHEVRAGGEKRFPRRPTTWHEVLPRGR